MTDVDNSMFYLPPELLSESIMANSTDIKALTNDDIFTIIESLSTRINDIYTITAALNDLYYEGLAVLLPVMRINANNTLRYLNLLNNACKALQEILKK